MSHTSLQYIILDAARMEEKMDEIAKLNYTGSPLLNTKDELYVQKLSAFLFTFQSTGDFANLIVNEGWGQSWGIYVSSNKSLNVVQQHLSRNMYASTDTGEIMYFRFYDPRVLRIFLPTCDLNQLFEFFGPVQKFIAEDEDPQFALIYSLNTDGTLKTEKVMAGQLFEQLKNGNESAQSSPVIPAFEERKGNPPQKRKWYFLDE
ncbi:MAG: DUF4123 domain-containing protein [Bacteroidia bacterium]|jgi:hypothetical protein|nr:DUF4123 domain-containing protein [Bacteroidia bacterium]